MVKVALGIINKFRKQKNMSYTKTFETPFYPPTSEIKKVVCLIRMLVDLVHNSIKPKYPYNHKRLNMMLYEVVHLIAYQIEQIEGVLCLAETNLFHYPSAFIISRTVLEINVVLEWLLQPKEEVDRILRYVSYLEGQLCNISNYEEIIAGSNLPKSNKNELLKNRTNIKEDIDNMKLVALNYGISSERISNLEKFPSPTNLISKICPTERQNELKLAYYVLSKFSHGMRQSIYRYHDPNFESYEPLADWFYPLYICYESIIASTQKILEIFDDPKKFEIDLKPLVSGLNQVMCEAFPDNFQ